MPRSRLKEKKRLLVKFDLNETFRSSSRKKKTTHLFTFSSEHFFFLEIESEMGDTNEPITVNFSCFIFIRLVCRHSFSIRKCEKCGMHIKKYCIAKLSFKRNCFVKKYMYMLSVGIGKRYSRMASKNKNHTS